MIQSAVENRIKIPCHKHRSRVRSIRPVSDVKKVLRAGFLLGAYNEMKLRDSSPKDTRAWTKRPSSSRMILSILYVSLTKIAVPPLLLV